MDETTRAEYVERFARLLEEYGSPRIAGRIYAHLATAPEPYLSLQELADQLGISRGSVSTNTRRLIAMKMIERVAVPGARGDHYAADPDGARRAVDAVAERLRAVAALAEEGLALQEGVVTPGTKNLRAMTDVYTRLADLVDQEARHTREVAG